MIISQADREREAGFYWLHHAGRNDLTIAEWTAYEEYCDGFHSGAYWIFMSGYMLYGYEVSEWRVISKIEPPALNK